MAVIATLLALLLKLALGPVIVPSAFLTFYGAILVSAWFGGFGPGLLATGLSVFFAELLFLPPPTSEAGHMQLTGTRSALFVAIAVAVSWGTAALRASQRRVAEVLQAAHDELEAQVAVRTAELREAEERFHNAFEYAPIGMALVSADGRPLQINAALCRMLGYTHEELSHKPIAEVMHPDDLAAANADRARLLSGELPSYQTERRYLHRSGTVVWAEMNVSVVRDGDGHPLHLVSHLHDITERKLADKALQESEGKFRTLAETVPVATVIFQGANVRYVNAAAASITGYTREELCAMHFWDVVHPEYRALLRERGLARQRGEEVPAHDEALIVTKSGETRWVDFSAAMIDFEGGRAVLGTAFDVTEHKRAEEMLRENERLVRDQATWLQSILNSLGEAVVVADEKGKLLYINPVAERLHGRGLADIAPEDWSREYGVCFPDGTPVPADQIPLVQATRGTATTANQEFAVRAYGQETLVPVSVTATPLLSQDGSLRGGVVVYRDISSLKQAETLLRRNEARLKEAERLAHAGAWERDLTTGEAIWSDELFRICGLEPGTSPPRYHAFVRAILPEDWQLAEQAFGDAVEGTRPFEVECRIARPHGEIRHVHFRGEVVRDATGRAVRMLGTALDVTERKQAESLLEARVAERTGQLRAAEERLRRLVEHLPAITYVLALDAAQSTLYISPQVEAVLGFTPDEWVSDPDLWNRQLHPHDRQRVIAEVAANQTTGAPFSSEYRMYTRGGALVWFHDEAAVIRDESGQLLFSQGVMIDITARKRAEEELEAANRRTRNILEEITDGFFALDQTGRFTYLNRSALRLLERSLDDLIGKNIWEEFPAAVGSAFYEQYQQVMAERVAADIESYYAPLNRWFRVHMYPSQQGASVLFEDVTQTHEKEVTTLSDILRALNAELHVATAFPGVAAGLQALTQCDRASLTFFDRDYDEATVIAVSGERTDVRGGTCLRMRDIPAAADIVAGRPHSVPDLAVELQSPIVRTIYADGYRSVLCLPLRGTEQVLGMLSLTWRQLGGGAVAQLPLLNQIADAVALAAEKGRLYEEVRVGHERLEALSRRLLEVQEAERQHIARELHDEIGQALTALKLSLDTVAGLSIEGAAARLNDTRRQVNELLARVRNLALDLRPAMLDDLGLLPALLWLFERYSAQTGVQVNFEHRGLEHRFDAEIETAAYRIVQEALTNVARHAGVQHVTVRAWTDASSLCVQIVDQGGGFDAEATAGSRVSSGVAGMRERALLLGGQLAVESARGKGTRVSAELPLGDAGSDSSDEVTTCP